MPFEQLSVENPPEIPGLKFRLFHGENDYASLAAAGVVHGGRDPADPCTNHEDRGCFHSIWSITPGKNPPVGDR
jgi:hypothetical protein